MPLGFTTIKDIIETITWIIGSLSFGLGLIVFLVTRHQFQHEVMVSCIERFQEILPQLKSSKKGIKKEILEQYIDLCNEELFYFKQRFIPKEVMREWIDGMLYYLPLKDKEGDVISEGKFPEIIKNNMLKNYPRIEKAFRISKLPDLENPNDRTQIIGEIRNNLRHLSYPCS